MQRTGLFDESSHDEHCGRSHASDRRQRRKVWRVAEVLDQEFGEDPYLACGMLAWRADDIGTCRGRWMTRHDRYECPRNDVFVGKAIGQVRDPESGSCSGD